MRGEAPTKRVFSTAAGAELAAARPLEGNAFKVALAQRTVAAVLGDLAGSQRMSKLQNAIVGGVRTAMS